MVTRCLTGCATGGPRAVPVVVDPGVLWWCWCTPVVAHGTTVHGPLLVVLHGLGCDEPVHARTTLVVRWARLDPTRLAGGRRPHAVAR